MKPFTETDVLVWWDKRPPRTETEWRRFFTLFAMNKPEFFRRECFKGSHCTFYSMFGWSYNEDAIHEWVAQLQRFWSEQS